MSVDLCHRLKMARAYAEELDTTLSQAESDRNKADDLAEFARLTETVAALRRRSAQARIEVAELNSYLSDKYGY